MTPFGSWLKNKFEAENISYRKFETSTGISRSNLTHYIIHNRTPTIIRVKQIAAYLAKVDFENGNTEIEEQANISKGYIFEMLELLEPQQ